MKKRDYSLDAIRVIACTMIVLMYRSVFYGEWGIVVEMEY